MFRRTPLGKIYIYSRHGGHVDLDPKIYRLVYLIRHGQYDTNPEELTLLGRQQAAKTAKVFSDRSISKLYCSTMPRAIETATYFEKTTGLRASRKGFFREGLLPGSSEFNAAKEEDGYSLEEMNENKNRADEAYEFLFQVAPKKTSSVAVVAHGNVIRYWVCCALGIDFKKWLSMDVKHASITTLRIDNKGQMSLLSFSETSHLPLKLQSYT